MSSTTAEAATAVPRRDDDVRRKLAIRKAYHAAYYEYQRRDMMYLLIILRFVNAITIRTFFQPDEYFQSLEPAWEMAFGASSGAWITWEWHHQLRSSLHPAIFAILYFVADRAMGVMSMYPQFKAIILAYLPKVFQGLVAAVGDYYTWQLAEKVYGQGSNAAFTTLLITALSPWQWFCSTRTLSNSLETVLTVVALYHWPWALYGDSSAPKKTSPDAAKDDKTTTSPQESQIFKTHADVNSLRICLFLAGIACLLRPTNLFIWASIVTVSYGKLSFADHSPSLSLPLQTTTTSACGRSHLTSGFTSTSPSPWLSSTVPTAGITTLPKASPYFSPPSSHSPSSPSSPPPPSAPKGRQSATSASNSPSRPSPPSPRSP
ncbi:hypothetical protein V492_04556 [Pseudogymnoascus sp. VKM F-4246]|nr:hypothetical protein V492_04556 [Pseudogymnoascus sp. VKM F-4246]